MLGSNEMLSNIFFTGDEHETHRFMGSYRFDLRKDFICLSVVHIYRRQVTVSYGEAHMLETLAILLIILWLLGLVSSYTLGGFIHILLVIAIIIIVLRVIQGRPV
jgi:hypothetical protein